MSRRTALQMDVIKSYAMLGKSCLILCPSNADKSRIEGMMAEWPHELTILVTIRSTEETPLPDEPKPPPIEWIDEASEMTREQWEWLEHWRKSTFPI